MKKFSALYNEVKEELESITESAEEYASSEESPLAEFVGDMFYGEVDASQINLSRCSDEAADAVKALIKRTPKNWRSRLREFCELVHVPDIYYRDAEILSARIGEQEHQIDSSMEVVEKIKRLSPEEFEEIKNEFLGSRCKQTDRDFWFYTVHDYERFALVLDEEALLKAVQGE